MIKAAKDSPDHQMVEGTSTGFLGGKRCKPFPCIFENYGNRLFLGKTQKSRLAIIGVQSEVERWYYAKTPRGMDQRQSPDNRLTTAMNWLNA